MGAGPESGVVELIKLKEGLHEFLFDFDQKFFEQFESSSLSSGKIHVVLTLNRLEQMFRANLVITGTVRSGCDYCLEDIDIPVNNQLDFVVRLSEMPMQDDEEHEIYYVPESDPRFNVSRHVYDLVYLGLPLQKTCSRPGELSICNQAVIGKLGEIKKNEENNSGDSETDPRWDKLKDLLN